MMDTALSGYAPPFLLPTMGQLSGTSRCSAIMMPEKERQPAGLYFPEQPNNKVTHRPLIFIGAIDRPSVTLFSERKKSGAIIRHFSRFLSLNFMLIQLAE
jgi:hypothetical protein